MANNSQGTSVVWSSVALGEVVSVSVDGVSADTIELTSRTNTGRQKLYRKADVDYGTVTVRCRGTTAMSTSNVGVAGALAITGTGFSFTSGAAIFKSLAWSASVGSLQEFTATFQLTE